jgi:hypothetical protein
VGDALLVGPSEHGVGGPVHELGQPSVHPVLAPPLSLQVLDPLDVGDHHTSGAGQDVGDHRRAFRLQDLVRLRRCGIVRDLEDQVRLDGIGVLVADVLLHGCGHEDLAVQREQVFVGDGVGLLVVDDARRGQLVLQHGLWIETLGIVDGTLAVGHGDDPVARGACENGEP